LRKSDQFSILIDNEEALAIGPGDYIGFLAPNDSGSHKVEIILNGKNSNVVNFNVTDYQPPQGSPLESAVSGLAVISDQTNTLFSQISSYGIYTYEQEQAVSGMMAALDILRADIVQSINALPLDQRNMLIQLLETHGALGILSGLGTAGAPVISDQVLGASAMRVMPGMGKANGKGYSAFGLGTSVNHSLLNADVLSFILGNLELSLKISKIGCGTLALFTGGGTAVPAVVLHKMQTFVGLVLGIIDGLFPTDLVYIKRIGNENIQCQVGDNVSLSFVGEFTTEKTIQETAIGVVVGGVGTGGTEILYPGGELANTAFSWFTDIATDVTKDLVELGITPAFETPISDGLDVHLLRVSAPIDLGLYQRDLLSILAPLSANFAGSVSLAEAVRALLYALGLDVPTFADAVNVDSPSVGSYDVINESFLALSPGEAVVTPQLFRFEERALIEFEALLWKVSLVKYYWTYQLKPEEHEPYYITVANPIPIPSYSLAVNSNLGNVTIGISPSDLDGISSASTPFTLRYNSGTTVTLSAPSSHNGTPFRHWEKDGYTAATSDSIMVFIEGSHNLEAVYSDTWGISGRITTSSGDGVGGVNIIFGGDYSPVTTFSDGSYSISVRHGYSGTATPALSGHTFTPPYRSYSAVTSEQIDQDYTATAVVDKTPTINQQPQSANIGFGQTAVLAVTADSMSPLSYQWFQGESGDTSNPIIGAISENYTTPALTLNTSYWVLVSNDFGSVNSSTAIITISGNGQVIAWGSDSYGRTDIPDSAMSGVSAIAAGSYDSLALKAGAVIAWGFTDPWIYVPSDAWADVSAIATAGLHSLALKEGKVISWGLLDGADAYVPAEAQSGISAIAAGYDHDLALKDGSVIAWGNNDYSQIDVPVDTQSGVSAIAAGYYHNLALKDGRVIAWGRNGYDQTDVPIDAQSGVSAISAGDLHSLALKEGRVIAWGYNSAGQELPVPAEVQSGVSAISAGYSHSMALKEGRVIEWEYNDSGFTLKYVPLEDNSGITAISAGQGYSMAIK
jgi:hypothetical protein